MLNIHIGILTLCFQSKKSDGILVKRERQRERIKFICSVKATSLKQSLNTSGGVPALLPVGARTMAYVWNSTPRRLELF